MPSGEKWKDPNYRARMLEIHKHRKMKHGFTKRGSKSKFYKTWENILMRVNAKTGKKFENYSGRGIICEWNNFQEFHADMYVSYLVHIIKHGAKNTSIDRIDNDGNYSKTNCRWATWKIQNNNQRGRINKILNP